MEMLKKRGTATVITVVVVVLATLFGVHRSVAAQIEKTQQAFYDGVYLTDEGYYEKSIASQLGQRSNAANGLVSIASGFDALSSETAALREAKNALAGADGISELYDANEALQSAYEKLYPMLAERAQKLPENQRAALESYRSTMDGAQSLIERSGYNGLIDDFNKEVLGAFPANLLRYPAFVVAPERFE